MSNEVNKGDEELVKLLGGLAKEVENYAQIFSSLVEDLNKSLIRFNAILYPTPEHKIKAVSLTSMDMIGKGIKEFVWKAKIGTKSITDHIEEIESIMRTSRIKCSNCDGKGEVSMQSYYREEEIVHPYTNTEKCPACNGKGHFEISNTIIQLTNELMDGLRELKQRRESETESARRHNHNTDVQWQNPECHDS